MSTTIFCTFEQQDLADLAMGQLRQIGGVRSIQYVVDRASGHPGHGAVNSTDQFYGLWGLPFAADMAAGSVGGAIPSRPASVKITCDDAVRKRVEAALINMHAYRIVTT